MDERARKIRDEVLAAVRQVKKEGSTNIAMAINVDADGHTTSVVSCDGETTIVEDPST
jgi:hypothetical protein